MKYFNIFLLFFIIASCNYSENNHKTNSKSNDCIDKILQLDGDLGESRNHSSEQISLSSTIDNYVKALDQLNFENCPIQFKTAFKKHQEAWIEMKKVTDNYPEVRGEMHDLFDQIESGKDSLEFNLLLEKIWSTWGEIETFEKKKTH